MANKKADALLAKHLSGDELKRFRGQMKARLPEVLKNFTMEVFEQVKEAAAKANPLAQLIADTAELLSVPEGVDPLAFAKEIQNRRPASMTKKLERRSTGEDPLALAADADFMADWYEWQQDPRLAAAEAYQCFAVAQESLEAGRPVDAAMQIALGAPCLARACTHFARELHARAGAEGKVRKDSDGKQTAMTQIKAEWDRWRRREVNYKGEADFGRKMHLAHPELTSDRSIAQAAARWKRTRNTSS